MVGQAGHMDDSHGSHPVLPGASADPPPDRSPIGPDPDDARDERQPESPQDSGGPDEDNGWIPV